MVTGARRTIPGLKGIAKAASCALWIAACVHVLVITLLLPPSKDVVVGVIFYMSIFTAPISVPVTVIAMFIEAMLKGFGYLDMSPTSYAVTLWAVYFIGGIVQWFWVVPWFRKPISSSAAYSETPR